jgi:hypothetical protein
MAIIHSIVSNGAVVSLGIISLITFFLLRWMIGKWTQDAGYKNVLTVGGTFVMTPVIYLVLIMGLLCSSSYYQATDFNQEEWMSNPDERFRMSEDIIDSRMLIGKTKAEIEILLGLDFSTVSAYEVSYYIGFVPDMFAIDPDVISIRFANDVVAEVRQRET